MDGIDKGQKDGKMTIAELIHQYDITIETPWITANSGLSLPTHYTLYYQGRKLSGSILTDKTVTCEQALIGLFGLAYLGQAVVELYEDAISTEHQLRYLLSEHYEEFYQAYLAEKKH